MAESTSDKRLGLRLLLTVLDATAVLLSLIGAQVVLFVAIGFLIPFLLFNVIVLYCQTQGVSLSLNSSWRPKGYTRVNTPTTQADEAAPTPTTSSATDDEDELANKANLLVILLDIIVAICCVVLHFVVGIVSSESWGHSIMMGHDVAMIFIICA